MFRRWCLLPGLTSWFRAWGSGSRVHWLIWMWCLGRISQRRSYGMGQQSNACQECDETDRALAQFSTS